MGQNNPEFDRLKQKYQSAINLMQQLQVRIQNINMEGTKLLIRGTAPTAEAKNRVWDQIKLIDAGYSDLICDLSVSESQPAPELRKPRGETNSTRPAATFQRPKALPW